MVSRNIKCYGDLGIAFGDRGENIKYIKSIKHFHYKNAFLDKEDQVKKVEEVFKILGEKAKAEKCDAMDGLIKEGEDIMKSTEPGPVRDAGIIAASQKVEHYEIASYGTLCAWAETLGEKEALAILKEILKEEKEADVTLTETAYNKINFKAAE